MTGTSTRDGKRSKTVRTFDFRRPSTLNRDHVRTLEIVQEVFCRQFATVLSTTLRAVSSVTVESIEQVSYDEYVRTIPNPTHLNLLSISPLPGMAVFQLPLSISFAAVDLLLGGHAKGDQPLRALSEIEVTLTSDLVHRVLSELRYAFESVTSFDPQVMQVESNMQFAQVAAPSDMIAVIAYDVRINAQQGRATLAFPYASLTPVLDSFTGNVVMAERDSAIVAQAQQSLEERLMEATVEVGVRFEPIRLTSGDLLSLQPGDVVPLNQPVDSNLCVTVEDKPLYLARAARRGKRLAAQILAPFPEVSH